MRRSRTTWSAVTPPPRWPDRDRPSRHNGQRRRAGAARRLLHDERADQAGTGPPDCGHHRSDRPDPPRALSVRPTCRAGPSSVRVSLRPSGTWPRPISRRTPALPGQSVPELRCDLRRERRAGLVEEVRRDGRLQRASQWQPRRVTPRQHWKRRGPTGWVLCGQLRHGERRERSARTRDPAERELPHQHRKDHFRTDSVWTDRRCSTPASRRSHRTEPSCGPGGRPTTSRIRRCPPFGARQRSRAAHTTRTTSTPPSPTGRGS